LLNKKSLDAYLESTSILQDVALENLRTAS
jgi:hypothetical protein